MHRHAVIIMFNALMFTDTLNMIEYGDAPCYDVKECLVDETVYYSRKKKLSHCKENLPKTKLLKGLYTFYNQSYNHLFVRTFGLHFNTP